MADRMRVVIDLNVLLDVLQRREPFYANSARVLAAAEMGEIEAFMPAHAATTLFYLLAKYNGAGQARVALTDLLQFIRVAATDQTTIEQALNLPYPDFEDAVLMMAAVQCGAQYVITRNIKDYAAGPLPALQPPEFLTLLET
ncbi:MAG: PIN domain-containing protein [Chloroflexota bacterium]